MRMLLLLLWPGLALADLDDLYARIAADLRAGKPLAVRADVALCDNHQISCGGHGLGDGDDRLRNLYWASSGGLRGWFERPGSGWRRLPLRTQLDARVVEVVDYSRTIEPNAFWRARGVTRPFEMVVHAVGWRGREIRSALESFAATAAAGEVHVAAYVGHNGWMDVDGFAWPAAGAHPAGAIAIACFSRSYIKVALPLLTTKDMLFAGSHALDGALQAVARGDSAGEIPEAAAHAYADGEGKSFSRVRYAFTY
jgi:hypothetical protein